MGKSYGTVRSRLNLCNSCYKPVVDDQFILVSHPRTKHMLKFHSTAQACANAEPLKKDWYRQHDRTSAHHRTKARLQTSDGYSWDTNDDMPMWLGDMES